MSQIKTKYYLQIPFLAIFLSQLHILCNRNNLLYLMRRLHASKYYSKTKCCICNTGRCSQRLSGII